MLKFDIPVTEDGEMSTRRWCGWYVGLMLLVVQTVASCRSAGRISPELQYRPVQDYWAQTNGTVLCSAELVDGGIRLRAQDDFSPLPRRTTARIWQDHDKNVRTETAYEANYGTFGRASWLRDTNTVVEYPGTFGLVQAPDLLRLKCRDFLVSLPKHVKRKLGHYITPFRRTSAWALHSGRGAIGLW